MGIDYSDSKAFLTHLLGSVTTSYVLIAPGIYMLAYEGQVKLELPVPKANLVSRDTIAPNAISETTIASNAITAIPPCDS